MTSAAPLWYSPKFSDVTIKVGNDLIRAHRFILARYSPVFSAMFSGEMKEAKENAVVEIMDFSKESVERMLRFMYFEQVVPDAEDLNLVLLIADYYQVDNIIRRVTNWIFQHKEMVDCIDLIMIGNQIYKGGLKNLGFMQFIQNPSQYIGKDLAAHLGGQICDELFQFVSQNYAPQRRFVQPFESTFEFTSDTHRHHPNDLFVSDRSPATGNTFIAPNHFPSFATGNQVIADAHTTFWPNVNNAASANWDNEDYDFENVD